MKIPPVFKLVFLSVLGLTVASAVAAVMLDYYPPHGDATLWDTFATVFKLGTGAVFGLIGGKATT